MGILVSLFDNFTASLVSKDLDKLMDLFTEDSSYSVYAEGFEPVFGKQAIRAFSESEFEKFENYSVEKLFVCEDENCIVVEWLVKYKKLELNKMVESRGVTIIESKQGLIQNIREYIKS